MQLIDLTQTFSIHTPGWVGYPSPKLSYFQRHATQGIVSQMLELPLHSGTHFDAEMHIISGGKDLALGPDRHALPRGRDRRHLRRVEDFSVIKPKMITDRAEVKKGDILIYNTGYHRTSTAGPRRMRSGTSCATPGATASSPSGWSRWSSPGPASTAPRATIR